MSRSFDLLPEAKGVDYITHGGRLYVKIIEGSKATFFFDKLYNGNDQTARDYRELYVLLAGLGDVVATNSRMFLSLNDSDAVVDYMIRRYGTISSRTERRGQTGMKPSFCTLNVSAVSLLFNKIIAESRQLVEVVAVGFTRKDDYEDKWEFKNSFVVFKRGENFEVSYGDPLNTANSAIKQTFENLAVYSEGNLKGMDKVVALLSI